MSMVFGMPARKEFRRELWLEEQGRENTAPKFRDKFRTLLVPPFLSLPPTTTSPLQQKQI